MNRVISRLPILPIVAALAAAAVLLPSAASAEPIAGVVQMSTLSPVANYTSCGSSSIANNATSGATLAAWPGNLSDQSSSAPLEVALVAANGVKGPTASYQPSDSFFLGYGSSCDPLAVDAGPNGGFIVTWTDSSGDNAVYGILVSAAGAFIGGAFAVSEFDTYSDIETVSASWSQSDGRFLVTWKAQVLAAFPAALNGQQLVGRFIDAAGAPIGGDFLITDLAIGVDNSQDNAYGAGIWIATVTAQDSVVRTVTVTAAGVVGVPVAIPAPVGASSNGPSVAYNPTLNQFMLVAKTGTRLWGQILDSTGAAVGASFDVVVSNGLSRPRVTPIGAEGWFMTWHNNASLDIIGVELNASGVVQGVPEVLSAGANDATIETNFRPEVAFSASSGQAYVIWSRHQSAPNETNVFLRAWQATAPAAVAAPAPSLAATGVDSDGILIGAGIAAIAGLALLAGVVAFSRRKGVLAPSRG